MYMDPFQPAIAKTATVAAGVAAATTVLPTGGSCLEVQNPGSTTIFIELSDRNNVQTAATVAASYPILPGQCKIIGRPPGCSSISTISTIAAQSLFVTAGEGN
jgi:hypothetical protein